MNRVIDLNAGIAMIVTDLHGDWEAYVRYRDRFFELRENGRVDTLIFLGDLIHHEGEKEIDKSVDIVLDVMRLQQQLGDKLICLMGNHEMPHIYSFILAKGEHRYTARFEWAMGQHRAEIVRFFQERPFYIRTRAGVTFTHAGAAPELADPQIVNTLFNFSHTQLLAEATATVQEGERPSLRNAITKMSNQPYDQIIQEHFAISSPDDPRYNDYLIGVIASSSHPHFDLLWSAFFNKNEMQFGKRPYQQMVTNMLTNFSAHYDTPQNFLISGHINCRGGHTIVNKQQLRLASGKHAHPRESGQYLLLNLGEKINRIEDLQTGLGSVFKH